MSPPVSLSLKIVAMLLTSFCAVTWGQTHISRLLPRPELEKSMLEPGTLAEEPPDNTGLHILILNGDRGINIIKKKTAVKPVVEVRDRNNLPVAGATVTFTAPNDGPRVIFSNGSRSITVTSESTGRATIMGLKPLSVGKFQIGVSASFHSQVATATLSMTNALTSAAAAATAAGVGGTVAGGGAGLSTAAIVAIVAGLGGAAAAGAGVALSHHGSSSSTTPTTITIGVGTGGGVSGPHFKRFMGR